MLSDRPICLFLFAHQDDEFAVFAALEKAVTDGLRPVCLYLTDGGYGCDPARRDEESRAVLRSLGVAENDIHFLGVRAGVPDAQLYTHMECALTAALAALATYDAPEIVYLLAWEGGHHDHDAAHAIGMVMAQAWPQATVRQVPLYHGKGLRGGFFRLLSPLVDNGPVQGHTIPWRKRWQYLRYCFAYPSQWKTWVAFMPLVVWHSVVVGQQRWQGVRWSRLAERPHAGVLLYEARTCAAWEEVHRAINAFLAQHRA